MGPEFTFASKLWEYGGQGSWFFITLPVDYAQDIKSIVEPSSKKGFGSLKVKATINNQTWETSIFPDSKSKSYVLPVKKEIRIKAKITEGDDINVTLEIKEL